MKMALWKNLISRKSTMKNGMKDKNLHKNKKQEIKTLKVAEFSSLKIHFCKWMKWTAKFLSNPLSVKI